MKIIVRIANGIGNQLFTYAAAYNFAKKKGAQLLIDDESGFYKRNKYELNNFKISSKVADDKYKFKGTFGKLKRKVYKNFSFLNKELKIIEEIKDKNKFTKFDPGIYDIKTKKNIYLEGYFQTEKYFKDIKKEILEEFIFKDEIEKKKNKYKELILKNNSVSIHIRKKKFLKNENHHNLKLLNKQNLILNLDNAKKGINYFEKKLINPKFFIWCDEFDGLREHFPSEKFIFIDNGIHKDDIYDLYLMSLCKNFIISPSTYGYWGAFLSPHEEKICLSPPFIINDSGYYGFSNNKDIKPDWWT
tara:strand:- start:228 stop:1133 length:906 start_codon:yes stop_codon:yes gene_type:complete